MDVQQFNNNIPINTVRYFKYLRQSYMLRYGQGKYFTNIPQEYFIALKITIRNFISQYKNKELGSIALNKENIISIMSLINFFYLLTTVINKFENMNIFKLIFHKLITSYLFRILQTENH